MTKYFSDCTTIEELKKAWVFSGTQKSRSRGRYTLNQLRDIHGSHVVETSSRKKIG